MVTKLLTPFRAHSSLILQFYPELPCDLPPARHSVPYPPDPLVCYVFSTITYAKSVGHRAEGYIQD